MRLAEGDAWAIARSLIVVMLIPLAIGLFAKARYSEMAEGLQPHMSQMSSLAIALMSVGGIILAWSDIVDLVGTGGLIVALIFLLASLAIGYFTAGTDPATRSVLGLGSRWPSARCAGSRPVWATMGCSIRCRAGCCWTGPACTPPRARPS